MSLQTQIREEMKQAMIAKNAPLLTTLRGLLAAFTNELVATKRKPDGELTDEEVLAIISRGVKQRKDSIEQFRKGNREDLAVTEEIELAILEAYLPSMMSLNEIRKVVEVKKAEMGEIDKSKMGMFMGAVMKDLKGKADGADVKTVIEELFA